MAKKRRINGKELVVGIVGGVGPEASNKFCNFLVQYNKAKSDQEHISFLHYCNPKTPDRTDFILGNGPDPTSELIKSCQLLKKSGADFLIIPCNTAHYFLPKLQESIDIPIVDMTKLLVKEILKEIPPVKKVGVLATTGSIKVEIYQKYLELLGIEAILPTDEEQNDLVMGAVYGKNGIKAGKKILAKRKLTEITNRLVDRGAEAIILGCTEIPLVLKQKIFDVKLFDPMAISAKEIVRYIEEDSPEEVVTVKYALTDFAISLGRNILSNKLKMGMGI